MKIILKNEVQKYDGIWQNFDDDLCPNANFLQKRIKAFTKQTIGI